jgi:hypothetical protein
MCSTGHLHAEIALPSISHELFGLTDDDLEVGQVEDFAGLPA